MQTNEHGMPIMYYLMKVTSTETQKMYTQCAKSKANFTAADIAIGIEHLNFSPKYQNIGDRKLHLESPNSTLARCEIFR